MGKRLSKRQEKILEFLSEYIEENGYPPSIREIGVAAEISSTSVVVYNLRRLEEAGYISRDREVSRGLKLTSATRAPAAPGDLIRLPLLGRIVAGEPIPVPASDFALMGADETIELTRDILGDPTDLYALEVEGDSMIDALVHDGDVVVMRHQRRVENGEMAAVWLKDQEAVTLKHFYQERGGQVRLQPANPTMLPIYVDPGQVEVQGKVVMVIRQL
jgi:repressor LexA